MEINIFNIESDLSRFYLQVMDVTFTNVLEGARQYFQGLPTGTNPSAGPALYPTEGHHRNISDQTPEMPPSSSYWSPQPTEHQRQSTGDHTSVQRPPSHNSDSSRPPSHSQYLEQQSRIHYPGSYQEQYATSHQQQQQQQSFQFPRPQSREAPSNHPQYQSHNPPSSPYQIPSPYHHQTPSPQLPRAPSREQIVPRVPSREQSAPRVPSREQTIPPVPSREQLVPRASSREQMTTQYSQASENYPNYSQSRSYYSIPSQPKQAQSNNTYRAPTSSQSYPSTQQQNTYYKPVYSSQQQTSHQNVYANSRPSNIQQPEVSHQNTHSSSAHSDNEQVSIRTTHNLPPIAAISNYHSSRIAREPTRPVNISNSRSNPMPSNYSVNTSQQSSNAMSSSSIIQQTPARSQSYIPSTTTTNYQQEYSPYTTQSYQQQYQYSAVVTTQAHSQVIMTTSNSSNYHPTTSSSSSQYYQYSKLQSPSSNTSVPRNQPHAIPPASQRQPQRPVDNLNGRMVVKRESPLDLSVKTVRTPADSTLGDADNDNRNKYYHNARLAQPSISAHRYPQIDVNSFSQSVTQRPAQSQSVTAPKVEFHPNFNVPSLSQPPKLQQRRVTDEPKRNTFPEKAHSSNRLLYESKAVSHHSTDRYPTVSIPSVAHVNSYIQSQQMPPKGQMSSIPRMDFPTPSHKTNSLPADIAPPIVPNKVPKSEIWRESIDLQIEQKLLNYQQQQQAKMSHPTSKPSMVNGTYPSLIQDKNKEMYPTYQKQNYENVAHHSAYNVTNHYQAQTNHSQTYVPSPATTHQYPNYGYPSQQPQVPNTYLYTNSKTIPNSSTVLTNAKNTAGGAVGKKVLDILRNSLEIKGQKKIYEQLKSHENFTQHPRSDVQHPSTDCPISDKQSLDTVIMNHATSNPDYDGLAAFLAARIRTKGELKQGGLPTPNIATNNTSISESRLQGIIENQLKSPMKQDTVQGSVYSAASSSPPKVPKDRPTSYAPRKRLFSRNEEDPTNNNVPLRDKSGMRSSSETSVFDFPDSDSESDMAGRESLEAMRKGRKSSLKHSTPIEVVAEPPRPPSPSDDIFAKLCDTFVEQLKSGAAKRKVRRKKGMEAEVLAKLETVTKENPLDFEIKCEVKVEEKESKVIKEADKEGSPMIIPISSEIKEEAETLLSVEPTSVEPSSIEPSSVDSKSTVESALTPLLEIESKLVIVSDIKKEDPVFINNKKAVRRKLVSSSDSSDNEAEQETKEEDKLESVVETLKEPAVHFSLPDLDPCPQSPTAFITADGEKDSVKKTKLKKIKSEPIDSDNESNSSFNIFSKKTNYDSEGSASVKSLPNTAKEMSILDKLLEKYGGRKKRKVKRKDDHSPKVIPKSENRVELLPTPSLEAKENVKESKKLSPVIKTESVLLGFRKTTINNFKDAFIKSANNIVGINEQFSTVVMKSRTRKQNRVLKQRATIKEVFGEDRPASAPPVTCVNDIQDAILDSSFSEIKDGTDKENDVSDTKLMLKNKLLSKGKKKEKNNVLKHLTDKKPKTEIQDEMEDETRSLEDVVIKRDPDEKSETPSIDGDDGSISGRRRGKYGKVRRKLSSGFDYIRKKKKYKKEVVDVECGEKKKRKNIISKTLESIDDIQKEIKTWVLNKGIGETHLHRAARLGYTDITAYCLEKMECTPSPKDNAGYTPLHEACSRGHLDIAKLLLSNAVLMLVRVLKGEFRFPRKRRADILAREGSARCLIGLEPILGGPYPMEVSAISRGCGCTIGPTGDLSRFTRLSKTVFVEIARLLLSYGADPTLATYSGLTPLALTNDEATKDFLKNHLNDIEGEQSPPWYLYGPATFFDPLSEIGYNILDGIPDPDPQVEEEDIEFEVSESLLPNLYTLRNESPNERWVLLQDLSNLLKIKSRDALLRQICPPSTSSAIFNYKSVLRELKMSDFLEQAHCCQFLNANEKVNTRASKIALVKYTDKVKELLNVETLVITTR
ncbi:hypothetical protein NQ317_011549 [Molorchus minor]|uniref:BCL-6 corepressor n=1 Tax=Molorchus minor TaxID=1323400 RepID=A0ABQ9IVJ5_9CUCU|nr:hypothetical protein NQ317_011549 [Molorchus minor]